MIGIFCGFILFLTASSFLFHVVFFFPKQYVLLKYENNFLKGNRNLLCVSLCPLILVFFSNHIALILGKVAFLSLERFN